MITTQGWMTRCERRGHEMFPDILPREFIPIHQICLRCGAEDCMLPYGECLGRHPIRDHYTPDGKPRVHPGCPGPY